MCVIAERMEAEGTKGTVDLLSKAGGVGNVVVKGHFLNLLLGGFPGADAPSIGSDKTMYST